MPRRRKPERARGPYPDRNGRRRILQFVGPTGKIETETYASESEAIRERDTFNAQVEEQELTMSALITSYERHLQRKGNKPGSIKQTLWAVRRFFGADLELWQVTTRWCRKRYHELSESGLSVDSHRGILAQAKTMCRWLVETGYLADNAAEPVRGVGRRRRGRGRRSVSRLFKATGQ